MTKQELEAALVLRRRLTRLENSLADIRATGGVKSSGGSGVRAGGGCDTGQIAVELAEEIAELRKKYEIEREIIRRTLEKAPLEWGERKVLLLRYVECKPWQYVCKEIGYAERQTFRIHAGALEKLTVDGSL